MLNSIPAPKQVSLIWVCTVLLSGFASDSTATDKSEEISIFSGILYFILRIVLMTIATGLLALALNLLMMLGKAIIRFSGKVKDFFIQKK